MHLYSAKYHIHLSDWYIFLQSLSFQVALPLKRLYPKKKKSLSWHHVCIWGQCVATSLGGETLSACFARQFKVFPLSSCSKYASFTSLRSFLFSTLTVNLESLFYLKRFCTRAKEESSQCFSQDASHLIFTTFWHSDLWWWVTLSNFVALSCGECYRHISFRIFYGINWETKNAFLASFVISPSCNISS